ncbi:hypothetical protein D3C77_517180 [compost metagenome]
MDPVNYNQSTPLVYRDTMDNIGHPVAGPLPPPLQALIHRSFPHILQKYSSRGGIVAVSGHLDPVPNQLHAHNSLEGHKDLMPIQADFASIPRTTLQPLHHQSKPRPATDDYG